MHNKLSEAAPGMSKPWFSRALLHEVTERTVG